MTATRFNPSVNGPLHLGHVYAALVNEAFAREHGGRFIVRWDDSHPLRIQSMGKERIANILQSQQRDLDWLEFQPDENIKQSDVIEDVRHRLRCKIPAHMLSDEVVVTTPRLLGNVYLQIYPLTPTLTAEKVLMDFDEGVTHLIRGVDLISEYSLYQYYCRLLEIPQPKHIYFPRLQWQHGDMSKTLGAKTVASLRDEYYTPQDVRDLVAKACLYHPPDGWSLYNIKGAPCL